MMSVRRRSQRHGNVCSPLLGNLPPSGRTCQPSFLTSGRHQQPPILLQVSFLVTQRSCFKPNATDCVISGAVAELRPASVTTSPGAAKRGSLGLRPLSCERQRKRFPKRHLGVSPSPFPLVVRHGLGSAGRPVRDVRVPWMYAAVSAFRHRVFGSEAQGRTPTHWPFLFFPTLVVAGSLAMG